MHYPDTFAEWHQVPAWARPIRRARSAALTGLYAAYRATGRLQRGLAVPRVQFFCFHHIFADEVEPFRRMMREMSNHFDFASWSEGVRMVNTGQRPERPVACFSSDDGLLNNLAMAQVFEEVGATGCFFINPVTLERRSDAFNAQFCREKLQAQPARFLSSDDVEGLLARGHEIGNHTRNHVMCSTVTKGELTDEIAGSKEELERRFGPTPHFAWPYGQLAQFSRLALRIAVEAGHESVASVLRGAHLAVENDEVPYLRRDQLWALDPIRHVLYFCARAGLDPAPEQEELPYPSKVVEPTAPNGQSRRYIGWSTTSEGQTEPV